MAHTRKSRNQTNHRRKVRPRRASTPSTPKLSYKALSPSDAPRHQYKKRQLRKKQSLRKQQQEGEEPSSITHTTAAMTTSTTIKHKPARVTRRLSLSVLKAKREQWASIAAETQEIVLGDGKYVEERCLPVLSPSLAQSAHKGSEGSSSAGPRHDIAHITHDIAVHVELSRQGTIFYPHYSETLAFWANAQPRSASNTIIEFTRESTLTAAHRLWQAYPQVHTPNASSSLSTSLGVFSFASPKKPGGGYLHGGDEQEEIIARLSSIVASLSAPVARDFYQEHRKHRVEDGSGLHDHSMVYSPGVVVFRKDQDDLSTEDDADPSNNPSGSSDPDDIGGQFIAPYLVNVLSAVPVNASMVRKKHTILPTDEQVFEDGIRTAMKERMARALRAFEERGDRMLVLGAFGCGSSENKVDVVARIWAELLVCGDTEEKDGEVEEPRRRDARFKHSFERILFAVPGKLHAPFKKAFEMRIFEEEVKVAAMDQHDAPV